MVVCVLFLLSCVRALHFYIVEGTEKCFIVDIPDNNVVLGQYALLDPPPEDKSDQGVIMRVTDPSSKLLQHQLIRDEGKFSFTSQVKGKHRICLTTTQSSWFSANKKIRFELGIDTTWDEVDHSHLASMEQVDHLQSIAEFINGRLVDIAKQQEYSREKEALFKDESEFVNRRVMYFTVFQTVAILLSGIWQIVSLRGFFKAKKILN